MTASLPRRCGIAWRRCSPRAGTRPGDPRQGLRGRKVRARAGGGRRGAGEAEHRTRAVPDAVRPGRPWRNGRRAMCLGVRTGPWRRPWTAGAMRGRREITRKRAERPRATSSDGVRLMPSERKAARSAAAGLSNAETLSGLGTASRAVERHLTQFQRRIRYFGRPELVRAREPVELRTPDGYRCAHSCPLPPAGIGRRSEAPGRQTVSRPAPALRRSCRQVHRALPGGLLGDETSRCDLTVDVDRAVQVECHDRGAASEGISGHSFRRPHKGPLDRPGGIFLGSAAVGQRRKARPGRDQEPGRVRAACDRTPGVVYAPRF